MVIVQRELFYSGPDALESGSVVSLGALETYNGYPVSMFESEEECLATYVLLKEQTHPGVATVYPPTEINGVFYLMWQASGIRLDKKQGGFILEGHLITESYRTIISTLFHVLKYMIEKGLTWDAKLENMYVKNEDPEKIMLVGLRKGRTDFAAGLRQVAEVVNLINEKINYKGGRNTEMKMFLDCLDKGNDLIIDRNWNKRFRRLSLLFSLDERKHVVCKTGNIVKTWREAVLTKYVPLMFRFFQETINRDLRLKRLHQNCEGYMVHLSNRNTEQVSQAVTERKKQYKALLFYRKCFTHFDATNKQKTKETRLQDANEVVKLFERSFPEMMPGILEWLAEMERSQFNIPEFIPQKYFIEDLLRVVEESMSKE